MEKIYGINTFVMTSGERYCHVIDRSSGLPEFYPNLFLTTQIRNRGNSSATVEAAAANLVVFLRFLDYRGIDIETRLLRRDVLREHELDDLHDFSQRRFGMVAALHSVDSLFTIGAGEQPNSTVHNGTRHSRLTTMASYLGWLATHVVSDPSQEDADRINAMVGQIRERRPVKRGRTGNFRDKSLPDYVRSSRRLSAGG